MKLKRQFGTNAFFLTTFFGTHFPCAAINKEYVGKRTMNRLCKYYGIIEQQGTIYILSYKD